MKIVKHSGNVVEYDSEKLKKSLKKSGASDAMVSQILAHIEEGLHEGSSTKYIYKQAFALLKKISSSHAARYNLKEAIRLLGPAGFYFEKYIARLFESEGYDVKTNLILNGHCVTHEIDVLVKKKDTIAMVECKFHMGKDANSDVKVPMYILSRFNDLKARKHRIFAENDMLSKCWIVNNNRFTQDAIDFAKCSNLHLLSWNYPESNNLKTKNDVGHLYPITCLTTMTRAEKEELLQMDIILVRDLHKNSGSLKKIGLSPVRIKHVMKEASDLCESAF